MFFPDPLTVCHVKIVGVGSDGDYLVQREQAIPVRRRSPTSRATEPVRSVLLRDVLTGAGPMPVSAWTDVTDHGVPDEPFTVSGRNLYNVRHMWFGW
jgi:hypothetical protein